MARSQALKWQITLTIFKRTYGKAPRKEGQKEPRKIKKRLFLEWLPWAKVVRRLPIPKILLLLKYKGGSEKFKRRKKNKENSRPCGQRMSRMMYITMLRCKLLKQIMYQKKVRLIKILIRRKRWRILRFSKWMRSLKKVTDPLRIDRV